MTRNTAREPELTTLNHLASPSQERPPIVPLGARRHLAHVHKGAARRPSQARLQRSG